MERIGLTDRAGVLLDLLSTHRICGGLVGLSDRFGVDWHREGSLWTGRMKDSCSSPTRLLAEAAAGSLRPLNAKRRPERQTAGCRRRHPAALQDRAWPGRRQKTRSSSMPDPTPTSSRSAPFSALSVESA